MPTVALRDLLERNARHVESLPPNHFDAVQESQQPPVVSVCCSDSRVSQEGMWAVDEPGWLFTPSTIGNQVWDKEDGERVVDGSVLYPIVHTGTGVTVIVGHTGCGAVTAALQAVRGEIEEQPPGIQKYVELLRPVIEDGLADDRVSPERDSSLVNQLVEYNVDEQVRFLRQDDDVPDEEAIFGFVYDFQGIYGDTPGKAYLVNENGNTDESDLRTMVPDEFESHVSRLL